MFLFALVYTAGTVSGMYGRGFGFLTFAILLVILIAECVASKGSLSGIGRIVVLLILISSAVFATAQFRYASVDESRDSYMQYMTDEKSVIVWGKIYKTEYKYFSYRYYMTDCVVQPEYGKAFGRKRIHTATLIKNVFAHTLRDLEISTIERKMSHTESGCKIRLNLNIT